ncbi:serine--tRNA ligase [Candidatus Kaiserbacteria bacterium RIFCSPHIGHO2_02_FULL_49_11]|uniref:Serine--tRNA ligase n=1 Tax=Candidatus Kaiserbacteria bacterium RIFCSPHIGHO2_02_FULL_49_11 TaxID=1798489 RepID=A0A1F6D1B3_9BACT|nr:MAG: serine--tRNA ligase [Candidatus Kaiserbacteria bacterium RIFCSPHIGHO2_02_FULL_49_11]
MLDINFIRENSDLVKEGARKKRIEVDIDRLLQVDAKRRGFLASIEKKRSEQNTASDRIAHITDTPARDQAIAEMKVLKDELQEEEELLKETMKEWQELMLAVPNIPDMSVPEGASEANNKELKTWGEKPQFDFEPRDHIELMTALDMLDLERGAKVHGFRGYFLKNDGALLSWAIWNYARDFFLKKDFTPFIPPIIVNKEYLYGTGHLPGGADDIFKTQDDQYLAGTAEVPMMAYHSNEVLQKKDLPLRYFAFSPCYRREAGSYSKDVKGLIRVHEFYKWEQLVLCEANHDESVKIHEELNRNTEEFIESLNIPYRQVAICTGDLKGAHVKSYDTELWVPKEGTYREIASASYYHDFQTRRFNTRYKDSDGKTKYVHSLNATAIPTPRILVSLVENFQQSDGSIVVPKILRKYFGKDVISK